MLKQQRAVDDPASPMYPDDRPRKKLSFREPEVVSQTTNGLPLSAPAANCPTSKSYGRHLLTRPHSIAGVFNLTGLSGAIASNVPGMGKRGTQSGHCPQQHHLPASPLPQTKSYRGDHRTDRLDQYNKSLVDRGDVRSRIAEEQEVDSRCAIKTNELARSPLPRRKDSQSRQLSPPRTSDSSHISPSRSAHHSSIHHQQMSPKPHRSGERNQLSPSRQQSTSQQPLRGKKESLERPKSQNSSSSERKATENKRCDTDQSATAFVPRRNEKDSGDVYNGRSRSEQREKLSQYIRSDSVSMENLNLDSQAMRIVRTVGQAFEVCHKYSSAVKEASPCPPSPDLSVTHSDSDDSADKHQKGGLHDPESSQEDQMTLTSDDPIDDSLTSPAHRLPADILTASASATKGTKSNKGGSSFSSSHSDHLESGGVSGGSYPSAAGAPLAMHHELQLVREQLEQQQQQTQAAMAQVHLLRDQLAAETAARLEAQARTHQLLVHNKELLEHIQALVLQIRELEITLPASPSIPPLPAAPDPTSTATLTPSLQNSPRLVHQQLQHQIHQQQQLQQQLQHHQQQQQQIQQQLQHQQQFQQQHQYQQQQFKSSSSSEQSSRESVTACIAGLFSPDGLPQHSPSQIQKQPSPAFFPASPTDTQQYSRRLPLVPEDSTLSSLFPPTRFNTSSLGSPALGTSAPPLGTSAPPLGISCSTPGPITRAASERMPRQNTLAQLQRMAWARHTTK